MNLQRIKILAENKRIEFKSLAKAIGMSEGNLHRCVRENRIQAHDLEKISNELHVSIVEFFDEYNSSIHTEGDFSPASDNGDVSVIAGDAILAERIKSLEKIIAEKDERIKDLKDSLNDLRTK